MQKNESPLDSILFGNILTALVGLPFMFIARPSATSIGILAVLGVFQLGLPYVLYAVAIKHVTALEASIIPIVEPVLNPVWVFLIMGEAPGRGLWPAGWWFYWLLQAAAYLLPFRTAVPWRMEVWRNNQPATFRRGKGYLSQ